MFKVNKITMYRHERVHCNIRANHLASDHQWTDRHAQSGVSLLQRLSSHTHIRTHGAGDADLSILVTFDVKMSSPLSLNCPILDSTAYSMVVRRLSPARYTSVSQGMCSLQFTQYKILSEQIHAPMTKLRILLVFSITKVVLSI